MHIVPLHSQPPSTSAQSKTPILVKQASTASRLLYIVYRSHTRDRFQQQCQPPNPMPVAPQRSRSLLENKDRISDQISSSMYLPPLHIAHWDWFIRDILTVACRNANDLVFLIAKDESKFTVHKAFACFYSPVLKAAFESEFIEGQTQTFRLSDYDADTVQLFVYWVYSQEVSPVQVPAKNDTLGKYEVFTAAQLALAQVWNLAGYLCVPRLQNYTIRKLEEVCDEFEYVPNTALHYVYETTAVDSPLRKWFLHRCI